MSTFCAKIGEFSYFLWNSSKSPPFWIIPTDPHPQKSVPPFGPKIPQNGKIPPFWPHCTSERISKLWLPKRILWVIESQCGLFHNNSQLLNWLIWSHVKVWEKQAQLISRTKKFHFTGINKFVFGCKLWCDCSLKSFGIVSQALIQMLVRKKSVEFTYRLEFWDEFHRHFALISSWTTWTQVSYIGLKLLLTDVALFTRKCFDIISLYFDNYMVVSVFQSGKNILKTFLLTKVHSSLFRTSQAKWDQI